MSLPDIAVSIDPRLTPGTITLRSPGGCDWGQQILGAPAHANPPEWRADAGCVHEHITTVYLCGGCRDRAVRIAARGAMYCRQCRDAGDGAHHCQVVVSVTRTREVARCVPGSPAPGSGSA